MSVGSMNFGNYHHNNCSPYINENGRVYKYTTEPMPQYLIAIFPPPYIKRGNCVYKIQGNDNDNDNDNHDHDWNRNWDRDNRNYYDYDDKKPGKVYRKVTSDSIIYYTYEAYPKGSSHPQYLMPVIKKIVSRRDNDREDNNFPYWGYPNYYPRYPQYYPSPYYRPYPYPQYPYYYPQPQPYYPYGYSRTFAAAPACKDNNDGPLSGLMAWGCQVQKDLAAAGDSTVRALTPAAPGSILDTHRKANPVTNSPIAVAKPQPGTGASKNCGGCNKGDVGCELGKLFCEGGAAVGGVGNSAFGAIGPYLPYIGVGVTALLIILLLKGR
jgi:hypothetical protein